MNKTLFFAIIVFLFFNISTKAQDTGNSIEISGTSGIKIFSPEKNYLTGPLFGGELAYHINMADNKRDYIRILNIKSIDAVFSYRNMSRVILNHDQATKGAIGDTYAILARLEMSLFKINRTELLFTPGFGFLYATETHSTNSQNVIIGLIFMIEPVKLAHAIYFGAIIISEFFLCFGGLTSLRVSSQYIFIPVLQG